MILAWAKAMLDTREAGRVGWRWRWTAISRPFDSARNSSDRSVPAGRHECGAALGEGEMDWRGPALGNLHQRRVCWSVTGVEGRDMMHLGLVMECDYREGATQEEAFEEAFQMADAAEELGLDGIWLAERHFAARGGPLDTYGTGIPSIVSAPLIIATAIAARTQRLRVGIAVNVLPLCHPIRIAEEAATVDQISKGRLDFGVGRSGFPRAYEGYGIPYGESRERFQECLDIILKAWTEEPFSHTGKYYSFNNLSVLPKPYQKPHPPVRVAATTKETFPQVGHLGYPIFIGLRGFDVFEGGQHLHAYRQAWRGAGHPGDGDVFLRIPIYVAETAERARSEPEYSTMRSYRRLAETLC